ncbi:hypothetical protein PCC9214_03536 [Planktothrix tepida]|uniref:Sugar 3,4-ketoisomerase QdtA cupin domain-containing protein n=2 Tax=Planktothrix TaxID=54304 RepID=A0A1J1LR74_9CYAN|nr:MULTISPECIES: dTDP-4-dehydrorhamnose 3,5-epimerase [Planktothrix]CAD5944169.1 hypothetical protein NO713_02120 [Planktothrix pseudagardhii]CAD5966655.1 hypothetical protein PCC9214_03536 [Planktothrix tepida]CUR35083.1 conserved hypothetical protein [Planktothrix tepida PCC 9214]
MGLIKKVEYIQLEKFKDEGLYRYSPLSSNETVLYELPGHSIDDGLFCHRFQTDQLLALRGSMVLVFIQNRHNHYVLLTENVPLLVTIPPGIPHAVMNPISQPCLYLNAIIRHSTPHVKDYQPIQKLFPFDMAQVEQLLNEFHYNKLQKIEA